MKSKKEILKEILILKGFEIESFKIGGIGETITKAILEAMDEYGRQSFEAATEFDLEKNMDKYDEYDDYLKEIENDTDKG